MSQALFDLKDQLQYFSARPVGIGFKTKAQKRIFKALFIPGLHPHIIDFFVKGLEEESAFSWASAGAPVWASEEAYNTEKLELKQYKPAGSENKPNRSFKAYNQRLILQTRLLCTIGFIFLRHATLWKNIKRTTSGFFLLELYFQFSQIRGFQGVSFGAGKGIVGII